MISVDTPDHTIPLLLVLLTNCVRLCCLRPQWLQALARVSSDNPKLFRAHSGLAVQGLLDVLRDILESAPTDEDDEAGTSPEKAGPAAPGLISSVSDGIVSVLRPLLFASVGGDGGSLTNDVSAILCFVSSRASADASVPLLGLIQEGILVRQRLASSVVVFPCSLCLASFLTLLVSVVCSPLRSRDVSASCLVFCSSSCAFPVDRPAVIQCPFVSFPLQRYPSEFQPAIDAAGGPHAIVACLESPQENFRVACLRMLGLIIHYQRQIGGGRPDPLAPPMFTGPDQCVPCVCICSSSRACEAACHHFGGSRAPCVTLLYCLCPRVVARVRNRVFSS